MRSALILAIVVTLVVVGLALIAHRFRYEAQIEPDGHALPVLTRVDRVTKRVQQFDFHNGRWLPSPQAGDSSR